MSGIWGVDTGVFGNVDMRIVTLYIGRRVDRGILVYEGSVSVMPGFDVGVFAG